MSNELLQQAVRRAQITPFPVRPPITQDQLAKINSRLAELETKVAELEARPIVISQPISDNENLAPPSVQAIKRAIKDQFFITEAELTGSSHHAKTARARQIGYYLFSKYTLLSHSAIGRIFGGRDHSTVLHGIRNIPYRMKRDPRLAQAIAEVELKLGVLNGNQAAVTSAPVNEQPLSEHPAGPGAVEEISGLDRGSGQMVPDAEANPVGNGSM